MKHHISFISFSICPGQSNVVVELKDESTSTILECYYIIRSAHLTELNEYELMLKREKDFEDVRKCPSDVKMVMNKYSGKVSLKSKSNEVIAEGMFNPEEVSDMVYKFLFGLVFELGK